MARMSQQRWLKATTKLIDQEVKSKPLSDQKLVERLKDSGMEISRRTVAKYREALEFHLHLNKTI